MVTDEELALVEAKTKLTNAKAELAELQLRQKQGELLPKELVRKLWNEKASIVKNKLLSLPEIAPVLHEKETAAAIKKELKARVYEILEELAKNEGREF